MTILKNIKHEMFAQAVARGMPFRTAYAKAGYKPSDPHASRLASLGMVADRIAFLSSRAAARVEIDQAKLCQMFLEDRRGAQAAEQWGAAIAAGNSIGKLLGLMIDRKEVRIARLDEMTDAELAALIAGADDAFPRLIEGRQGSEDPAPAEIN